MSATTTNDLAMSVGSGRTVTSARSARILVIDADPQFLSRVSTALEEVGHAVKIALDAPEGLTWAGRWPPHVIVLGTRVGDRTGRALAASLRLQAGDPRLPAIFVPVAGEPAPEGSTILDRPSPPEKMVAAVEQALADGKLPSRPSDLSGRLQSLSIASVLTVLELERKTGWLILRDGPAVGRIMLQDGVVTGARANEGKRSGPECAYGLLAWTTGSFDFFEVEVLDPPQMDMPISALLLEGARQLDEASREPFDSLDEPALPWSTIPEREGSEVPVIRGQPIESEPGSDLSDRK